MKSLTRPTPGPLGVVSAALLLSVFALSAPLSAGHVAPKAKTKTLANGMRLIVVEQRELPTLTVCAVIRAGSKYDAPEKSGIATLTVSFLRLGAADRVGPEMQRYIDSLGIQFLARTNRNVANLSLEVTRQESLATYRLLRDMLSQPRFETVAFERLVKAHTSAALQAFDVGSAVTEDLAYGAMFTGQSLGAATIGTPESLQRIQLEDVRSFFESHYTPDRVTLIVSGDIEAKRTLNLLSELFYALPANKQHAGSALEFTPNISDSVRFRLLDAPQSAGASVGVFALGSPARERQTFAAELMLAHLLGGYPEISYLGRRLVEEERLITNLRSSIPYSAEPPLLRATFNCAAEHVVDVVSQTLEITTLLGESRISKRELEEGKQYFRGSFTLAFESASDICARFAEAAAAGVEFDYIDELLEDIESLTQADIRAAAARLFAPGNQVIVIVGDSKRYMRQLEEFGGVSRVQGAHRFE
ncbi:MAG: M16 family metallopeptidase [Candidatus Zixiibacteriota bacterium]